MNDQTINILILEDDEDDAFYIIDLIYSGISYPKPVIDHISDHRKIHEQLKQKPYDICFLDYRLGEVDGIHLLRTLRAKDVSLPIVLLTGQGDQEVAVAAMKAGATDYISKKQIVVRTAGEFHSLCHRSSQGSSEAKRYRADAEKIA